MRASDSSKGVQVHHVASVGFDVDELPSHARGCFGDDHIAAQPWEHVVG